MRQSERGSKGRGKRGALPFWLPSFCSYFLFYSIYIAIQPLTPFFFDRSLFTYVSSLCSRGYAGEIRRVPTKFRVQLRQRRPRANLLHNDALLVKTRQGLQFSVEEDVARTESRSRSLGGKLVVMVEMKNTTLTTVEKAETVEVTTSSICFCCCTYVHKGMESSQRKIANFKV